MTFYYVVENGIPIGFFQQLPQAQSVAGPKSIIKTCECDNSGKIYYAASVDWNFNYGPTISAYISSALQSLWKDIAKRKISRLKYVLCYETNKDYSQNQSCDSNLDETATQLNNRIIEKIDIKKDILIQTAWKQIENKMIFDEKDNLPIEQQLYFFSNGVDLLSKDNRFSFDLFTNSLARMAIEGKDIYVTAYKNDSHEWYKFITDSRIGYSCFTFYEKTVNLPEDTELIQMTVKEFLEGFFKLQNNHSKATMDGNDLLEYLNALESESQGAFVNYCYIKRDVLLYASEKYLLFLKSE